MSCFDQVSNLLNGLAETGFVKEDLSEEYRQLLLKEVLRLWNQMDVSNTSTTISG
jgi:hypothetical protein